jgi:hypothetical protein
MLTNQKCALCDRSCPLWSGSVLSRAFYRAAVNWKWRFFQLLCFVLKLKTSEPRSCQICQASSIVCVKWENFQAAGYENAVYLHASLCPVFWRTKVVIDCYVLRMIRKVAWHRLAVVSMSVQSPGFLDFQWTKSHGDRFLEKYLSFPHHCRSTDTSRSFCALLTLL